MVVVSDWEFSTASPCDDCGERPEDYWQMTKVNKNWICIRCLGKRITGI